MERRKVDRWFSRKGLPFVGPVPDQALAPGTDTLPQIKHIVVLMMENHTYDNHFGTMAGRGDGFAAATGDLRAQKASDGSGIDPHHLASTVQAHRTRVEPSAPDSAPRRRDRPLEALDLTAPPTFAEPRHLPGSALEWEG